MDRKILGKELINFVREYKEKPCLWDIKSPDYKNLSKKKKAYEHLAQMFEVTTADVKLKINGLRTNFKRELQKESESKEGNGEVYTPKVYWYDEMSFLKSMYTSDTVKSKKRRQNESSHLKFKMQNTGNKIDYKDPINNSMDEDDLHSTTEEQKNNETNDTEFTSNNMDNEDEDFTFEDQRIQINPLNINYVKNNVKNVQGRNEQFEDEIEVFTKSLASQLKSLPKIYCYELMSELQNMISKKKIHYEKSKIETIMLRSNEELMPN